MTAEPPPAIDPNFRIELPNFEGPLDLLLYLIQKHELDVLDLPVSFVTQKYIEYLGLMERLNLDVAAEYLVMAATLAHIKSKMLLPKPPPDQEEEGEEGEDPRAELIRRLLEYQKYKKVAEELTARGVAGRDVFPRGTSAPAAQGEVPLANTSLFKLLEAFQKVVDRTKQNLTLEVSAERITIQERIGQVTDQLQKSRQLDFQSLFEDVATRYDLVVTFLALLEMAKMSMLHIYQADPDAPLYLEYRLIDVDEDGNEIAPVDGADAPLDEIALESPPEPLQADEEPTL